MNATEAHQWAAATANRLVPEFKEINTPAHNRWLAVYDSVMETWWNYYKYHHFTKLTGGI